MPDRIADLLASLDPDFIGLQELQDRQFAGSTVSHYLASRLAMHAYRGPALMRGRDSYGNLLLSRSPARRFEVHDLSIERREPRGAIEADFDIGGRSLRMFVTHLGLAAAERREQVRLLLPRLERDDADIRVLAGDINEWRAGSRTLRALSRVFGTMRAPRTYPVRAPVLALDRIYIAPTSSVAELRAVASGLARVASDHLPLRAAVRL